MRVLTILIVASLFLVSCATQHKKANINEYQRAPEWVYGNTPSDKICYVGSAMPHVSGKPYQRALALSRGIEGNCQTKKMSR